MTRQSYQQGYVSNPIRTREGLAIRIRYRVRTAEGKWIHKSETLRGLAGKKAARPSPAREASKPRAESKGAKILALISRPKGASLAEIQKATDWQAHSVRGFLSTAAKKHGLKIESTKTEAGDRVYQIKK